MTGPTIVFQQACTILRQYGWERRRALKLTGVETWRWGDYTIGLQPSGDDELNFAIARGDEPIRCEHGADLRMLIGALPS